MSDKYDALTDAQLEEIAASMMYGPPPAHQPNGSGWYPPAINGLILGCLTLEFSADFSAWWRTEEAREIKDEAGNITKKPRLWNLIVESVIQQNASGVQVEMYRAKLLRGQVIDRDSGIGYALDSSMARALTVATLRAAEYGA